MLAKTTLSVIIPFYNCERYLEECIHSVMKSDFQNFELILVDDGSTDNSLEIAQYNALKYNELSGGGQVIVIQQPNKGVSSARNLGIEISRGEWITFIDSDDFISESFLSNLLNASSQLSSCDLVQAGCTNYKNNQIGSIEQIYENKSTTDYGYILGNVRGLTFSKLFKRSIILKYSIRFDEKMRYAEDLAFTLDYILYCNNVVFTDEVGYYYRRHPDSTLAKQKAIPYDEAYHGFKHLFDSFKQNINTHNISERQQYYRKRHIGSFMLSSIGYLYHSKIDYPSLKKILRSNYTDDMLNLIRSNPYNLKSSSFVNKFKILPFKLLLSHHYYLFHLTMCLRQYLHRLKT